ncbi:DNA-binding helix-turn-helix protein [Leptospira inadai serovar Lyme str. 10]|uniref:DNA-binding helix-turn-helix protein n=2 Tax=Leptospira inadai serovar Lyme TaxID=293084 RepID=V6HC37_9LEPT|nr:AraC family transcriptional regulator [Leptospira inadai]EQA37336.1 DNA-binding helix-turn-helix protein [Leptospira inadai serovar Lyme str. 10]PNV73300.1 AraC family transcriptional regulator [Leptospira inadai serovar Lyme]
MKRTITSRDGVGITASVRQKFELYLSRVVTELPTLVYVKKGTKTMQREGVEYVVRAGEAVAIAGGWSFDVVNAPEEGEFEASWLAFHPDIIRQFGETQYSSTPIEIAFTMSSLKSGFLEAFELAIESITTSRSIPTSVAAHRVTELLLWLSEYGKRFQISSHAKLTHRVRSVLNSAPANDWSASDIASQMAISEATLRRKLALESVSFSELLIDVRMSHALSLLQSTDLSIGEIAKEVGYESASRFAVRFRDRFGHSPADFRRNKGQNERIGTTFDRV